MAHPRPHIAECDPLWRQMRNEAETAVAHEPILGSIIHAGILYQQSFERALGYRISMKLGSAEISAQALREIADEAIAADPQIALAARADLQAVFDRDPACHSLLQALLFFKGYLAIQCYRIAHWLWKQGRHDLAYLIQMRMSEVFTVDIHPAARIGRGLMIDHGHGIVIGETAVVGDDVSILHNVTLGGTGKSDGDRHPKIGNGVMIGAGAKVLGNIHVGDASRIASGSVVLKDVPFCTTVAGVPARVVGAGGCDKPASQMDQTLDQSFSDAAQ
ncbi:serine O-acetyltransferase [Ketogulonicigenium vulgare]|uniref:Serine acetyltransferase n=1 Tax=Ketogulonicigenium vulgare (strain WSH-001) TaxID=759362 RepID=F9Y469_KETVW|nr:serine O-acetyltransferase [Ketogulonicigenium vulgare]ADO42311.1 serine acetyltransferase [Ketogulonicigenium vulgare Y25]AEM40505.1 Serine O-acetyltransferase, putative [Ketogulonicigenium vulgare WSH-001]ALJ80690.1 serine acetyltransferase [Ketogulonicigenium vulgare]ANW33497.1 serine O-acetyltransferase [Ketogulonicigenium vulgare]AOZ54222.1 serine acetyltransferase [Ketogulonicigenium vulgare]